MSLIIRRIILSLFLAAVSGFSFGIEASAHQYKGYTHSADLDISAKDITDITNKDSIKNLVLHLSEHINQITTDPDLNKSERSREFTIFLKRTRETEEDGGDGVFHHNDIYSIGITSEGYIPNHSRYPDLYGRKYVTSYGFENANGTTTGSIQTLLDSGLFPDNADPVCVDYNDNGENKVACGIGVVTPVADIVVTNIIGFHHARDDYDVIDKDNPDCGTEDFRLSTTAKQVNDEADPQRKEDLLVQHVKEIAEKSKAQRSDAALRIITENPGLASPDAREELENKFISESFKTISCYASGDFKYGSIYSFMLDPVEGISIINGLDFDLHGLSVGLEDPDPFECDGRIVWDAFRRVVTDGSGNLADLAEGNGGFVTYHWANPEDPSTRIEDYIEKNSVPGLSIKKSYIEVIDITPSRFAALGAPPQYYIVGSGIYLDSAEYCKEDEAMRMDDGGCAITATADTPRSALFNLFLMASILFSAVFLRKRV